MGGRISQQAEDIENGAGERSRNLWPPQAVGVWKGQVVAYLRTFLT